jgi:Uma2 family endonuclease
MESAMLAIEPTPKRWTREQYSRMAEMGWFRGRRVELIEGEIVEMSPQHERHATGILLADRALRPHFGDQYSIRIQMPLRFTGPSDPEPDLAVVYGSPRDFTEHPSSALLIVEISDTTLAFDRGRKADLYARHGIEDYWLTNLVERQVEVRRGPMADAASPSGFRYASIEVFKAGARIAPLTMPAARVEVAALLP